MNLLISLVVFGASVISMITARNSVNPEQTRFAHTRCMEEAADKLADPVSKNTTISKWRNKELPDEPVTHCYVRCSLIESEIYDPFTRKFSAYKINQQWERYSKFEKLGLRDEEVGALRDDADKIGALGSDDCKPVYDEFVKLFHKHNQALSRLYHGDEDYQKKIYDALGQAIKQKEQTYFEYCDNLFYPKNTPLRKELCEIRQFKPKDDVNYQERVHCVLSGFRYITEDFDIDENEIARDIELIGKDENGIRQAVRTCQENEPGAIGDLQRAWYLYKCLLADTNVAQDFKDAVDYREVRSRDYKYLLVNTEGYNKEAIQKLIEVEDKNMCPSR